MRRQTPLNDEQLQRLSAELTQAFAADETEIAQTADSPFLFRRIQAHIAAEENRRAAAGNSWLAMFFGLRRALPVFAVLAAFTIGGALFAGSGNANETPTVAIAPASNASFDAMFIEGSDDVTAEIFDSSGEVRK